MQTRLAGKTLYVACVLDGLVGRDLGLQQDSLKKLEGAMLSSTRAALSTDAEIDFLAVKARDSRLGATVTLVRYFPDIKGLIFFRLSRSDFEDRLVLESESAPEAEKPEEWRDISMTEFMARLAASRLQRQFTSNPLISVFLQVRRVTGLFQGGVLQLQLDKFDASATDNPLVQEIVRGAVEDTVKDILLKYRAAGVITRVLLKDNAGRLLLDIPSGELLKKKEEPAAPPKAAAR